MRGHTECSTRYGTKEIKHLTITFVEAVLRRPDLWAAGGSNRIMQRNCKSVSFMTLVLSRLYAQEKRHKSAGLLTFEIELLLKLYEH